MNFLNDWRFLSVMAIITWGLWGFFSKLSENYVDWKSTYALFCVSVLVLILIISPKSIVVCWQSRHCIYGLAAGISCGLGCYFFYRALSKGNASAVIPITSLYVIVSVVLVALFLKEPITWKNVCGIFSAIVAVVLLSI